MGYFLQMYTLVRFICLFGHQLIDVTRVYICGKWHNDSLIGFHPTQTTGHSNGIEKENVKLVGKRSDNKNFIHIKQNYFA